MKFTGGLPETACGLGSTVDMTAHLRAALPRAIARLHISVLLDAPCGDCNWISKINLGPIWYIGVDEDQKHLLVAERNFPTGRFERLNILTDQLPFADAVLCRDFLQHLPNSAVVIALRNLLATDARWFLMTSHDAEQNEDTTMGGFRPLNLTKPPISLPRPLGVILDPPESGRVIGIWQRAALERAFA